MNHIRRIRPEKTLTDQVDEVLAQNRKILAMNERLLLAILNPPHMVEAKMDPGEFLRSMQRVKPE